MPARPRCPDCGQDAVVPVVRAVQGDAVDPAEVLGAVRLGIAPIHFVAAAWRCTVCGGRFSGSA